MAVLLELTLLTDAVAAVEFKIGANRVTAHDAMTVTTTVSPAACVISQSVNATYSGVATYSSVSFTGYIGVCTMTFAGKFTSTGTPTSTDSLPAAEARTVIASSMVIGTALPASPLVGGTGYTFTGVRLS